MKRIIVASAMLAVSLTAFADYVASNGRDSVRLFDAPCANSQVLERVPPQYHGILRSAQADVNGATFALCWFVDGDAAHLLYGDGDQGLVPLAQFRESPGT